MPRAPESFQKLSEFLIISRSEENASQLDLDYYDRGDFRGQNLKFFSLGQSLKLQNHFKSIQTFYFPRKNGL